MEHAYIIFPPLIIGQSKIIRREARTLLFFFYFFFGNEKKFKYVRDMLVIQR